MYVRMYLPTFVSNLSAFLVAILNDARQKIMEKKSPVKKRVRNESVRGTIRKDCWMFMEIKNSIFSRDPPLPPKQKERKEIYQRPSPEAQVEHTKQECAITEMQFIVKFHSHPNFCKKHRSETLCLSALLGAAGLEGNWLIHCWSFVSLKLLFVCVVSLVEWGLGGAVKTSTPLPLRHKQGSILTVVRWPRTTKVA